MKVRVKVDEAGYFDLRFRKEGEVFDIPSEQQFSDKWMEKVDPPAPPAAPVPPVAVVPPVEPKVETPVAPKVAPKVETPGEPEVAVEPEAKAGEPKPATGDQKVL